LALLGLSLGTPQGQTDNQGRGGGDRPDRQRVSPPPSPTPPPTPPPTCSPKIDSPSYKKPEECYLDTDEDGKIEDGLLRTIYKCTLENPTSLDEIAAEIGGDKTSLSKIAQCCKDNNNAVPDKAKKRLRENCMKGSNAGAKFSHLLCWGVHPADIVKLADCEANNNTVDEMVACAFP